MAANDIEIGHDVDEDIVIDKSNLEQFKFFTSTEIVTNGLLTTDEMFQSTGIELNNWLRGLRTWNLQEYHSIQNFQELLKNVVKSPVGDQENMALKISSGILQ